MIKNYLEKNKLLLSIIVLITFAFVSYVYVYASNTKEIIIEKKVTEEKKEIKYISVDIKGAVKKPGVYKIESGKLINDLIVLSGGLATDADTSITNLAYELIDNTAIKIYTIKEVKKLLYSSSYTECICPTITNQTCITSNINTEKETTTETKTSLISINTGTASELDTLSGIGPSIASKIIAYRETNGLFKTIEEIKNVSGIGDSLFAKIKDYITI